MRIILKIGQPVRAIFLYFLSLLALLVIGALTFINPDFFPLVNLSSVLLPFVAILMLISTLLLMFFYRNRYSVYVPVSFLCLWILLDFVNVSFGDNPSTSSRQLAILDYNVSFFKVRNVFRDGYNDPNLNTEVTNINNLSAELNPDIICFQEFFNDENSILYNSVGRYEKLGYEFFLMSSPKHDNGLNRGLITFSKFPIVNSGIIIQSENRYNGAIFTDLKVGNDTVRLVNVHLNSMELHFSRRGERNFLSYLSQTYSSTNRVKQGQLRAIEEFINESRYPLIIVGDFNDNQYSYTYRNFSSRFENGHEESGNGLGLTYYTKIPLLAVRIDHLFFSDHFESLDFKTLSERDYSEHKPIWCKLQF